jgi:ribosomal protein L19
MQDSSNLEDLGILGGGNSFKQIILMKSTVTVQSTVTVRRTLTASAVRVAYGTDSGVVHRVRMIVHATARTMLYF